MNFGVYKPELRALLDQAMYGPLPMEVIRTLPLHTRCRLIRHMTLNILANKHVDWNNLAQRSLELISKSFDVSEGYQTWHEKRKAILMRHIKQKPFRQTLNILRHWGHASDTQRKEALAESASLHHTTFTEGLSYRLPIRHVFVNMRPRRHNGSTYFLYGTFNGDLEREKGKIKQNTHPLSFNDASDALNTAHHEMSHAIHFSLAVEYHHSRIRPDHPLYEDARYFHAMEVRKADVPPSIPDAYRAQTFEFLAGHEGKSIAQRIYELAH